MTFPLTLTPRAREEIRALGGHLYLSLMRGGCCGTAYCFALEEHSEAVALEDGDVTLHFTPEALAILRGAKLDYGPRLKPPRFRVLHNPNTPERCACNRSFGQPFPGKSTPQCRAYCPMPWQGDQP